MPNQYIIKCMIDGSLVGYLSIDDDERAINDKRKARVFDSLLAADSYAIALDMTYQGWQHVVAVL